jgi:hypothetical protein
LCVFEKQFFQIQKIIFTWPRNLWKFLKKLKSLKFRKFKKLLYMYLAKELPEIKKLNLKLKKKFKSYLLGQGISGEIENFE